jgi:hypothetical protein
MEGETTPPPAPPISTIFQVLCNVEMVLVKPVFKKIGYV